MKFKTGIHFLVAAMIAFGATSCGSDNSTDTGTVVTTAVSTVTTDLVTIMQANPSNGVSTKAELLSAIANHQFDQASTAGIYSFVNSNASNTNSKCTKFLGIPVCYSTNISTSTATDQNFYRRLNVDGTIDKDFSLTEGFGNNSIYKSADTDANFGGDISSLKNWLYDLINTGSNFYAEPSRCSSVSYDYSGERVLKGCKGFVVEVDGWVYSIDLGLPLIMNPWDVR